MGVMRRLLIQTSESRWMREHATRYGFLRRATRRFMPGEELEDALRAAQELAASRLWAVLTRLGENVTDRGEASEVVQHYLDVLDRIRAQTLPAEISVKPTQLGLDLDPEFCFANVKALVEHSPADRTVWIDMEQSQYVDATLDLYRRARQMFRNVGVCVQAYLYRTEKDLESLLPLAPSIRLAKGAYNEPPSKAFPKKKDVDENYFRLAQELLSAEARNSGVRAAMATHDRALIRRIADWASSEGIAHSQLEFQMLYGIRRAEQLRLAQEGFRCGVLISYGSYWFPWYMRRLAERPANLLFIVRNLFSA